MNILLIEDDFKIASYIKRGLEEQSLNVELAYDGFIGKRLATSNIYDLIVMDIILPSINGFDLCTEIRASNIKTPILFLTAMDNVDDKVNGFNCGADDYLVKPFELKELVARIYALNRRSSIEVTKQNILKVEDLEMNFDSRIVKKNNVIIEMTSKEYSLLEFFLLNKDKIVTRAQIAEHVWKIPLKNNNNVIDVYVNFLRKKIDKDSEIKLIHTVVGMGYILREPIKHEDKG